MSLPKYKDELIVFICNQPFDIINLNEIRLDSLIDSHEVDIPCYELIRNDRNGIAMYLKMPFIKLKSKVDAFVLKLENQKESHC